MTVVCGSYLSLAVHWDRRSPLEGLRSAFVTDLVRELNYIKVLINPTRHLSFFLLLRFPDAFPDHATAQACRPWGLTDFMERRLCTYFASMGRVFSERS